MIFDIIRFNQYALDLLKVDEVDIQKSRGQMRAQVNGSPANFGEEAESIGQYLDREGYSHAFRDDYLIPMTAAVWSTSPDKCSLDFPAVTLVRFM